MGELTVASVRAAKTPGSYQDGKGLFLLVRPSGSRSWMLRIQVKGRRRDFGIGKASDVSLADARDEADRIRQLCLAGIDPVEEKKKRLAAPPPTFKEAAKKLHAELKPSWREGKHQDDWLSSLDRHAFPKLGKITVDKIDGPLIRETLLPIWLVVPETARRVRQRIGAVLDWAYSQNLRDTEAPLRSVSKGLPRQPTKKTHFEAMPYTEVGRFIETMRTKAGTIGRVAMEFTILTASRSGMTRGAKWDEFDLDAAKWTVPGDRMKGGDAHEIPLPARALAIVKELKETASGDLVFPGNPLRGRERPMSDMTLTKVLRDAKLPYTTHGFRSSFRDWVAEKTNIKGEIAEAALAHVVKNPTERAYHRTKYFDKRRKLMEAWAGFLARDAHQPRGAVGA